jgi:hypothetical protein
MRLPSSRKLNPPTSSFLNLRLRVTFFVNKAKEPKNNAEMMRSTIFFSTLVLLLLVCRAAAVVADDDLVREDRIKVFLYAKPAFWSEVAIDAYKDVCTHLDNNLSVLRCQEYGRIA